MLSSYVRVRSGGLLALALGAAGLTGACASGATETGAALEAGSAPAASGSDGGAALDGSAPATDAGSSGPSVPIGTTSDAGSTDGGSGPSGARDAGVVIPVSSDAGPDASAADAGTNVMTPTGDCTANLLPLPEDPKQRGPWDVGVRTVKIGRLTVELTYPAKPGSTAGKPEATYDIRDWLPPAQRELVPADHSPAVGPIGGHLYRDVPIDETHGPYPVVIFIHGTASFRIASGTTATHWASRGFVVASADYPGLGFTDQLIQTGACQAALPEGQRQISGEQDIPGDVMAQISALTSASGELAFLASRVDMKRLAISGHSQGGCISATLSTLPNVRIVMPLSGATGVEQSNSLQSILYVSGIDDTVIGYSLPGIGSVVCPLGSFTTDLAFGFSPGPPMVKKRIAGITGGGHLVVTDLCQTNAQGRNAIQEANQDNVCGINDAVIIGLPALFDCGAEGFDWKKGVEALNYVTTAALEETLHCLNRDKQFASLKQNVPLIGDFREEVK